MINDNKAYNLRKKAVSRFMALPAMKKENYVLDSKQKKYFSDFDSVNMKNYKSLVNRINKLHR